jgi:hypothetical protein
MGRRSNLAVDERMEAVLTLLRNEEPVESLAWRCQVSEQTLAGGP